MGDIVPSTDQQANDGDGVADVQQHDTRRDHAVEGGVAPQVETAQDGDQGAGDAVRDQGDVETGFDAGEGFPKGQAAVAGEAPAEAGLPRVARDKAADARGDDEGFEDDGARFTAEGLVEEFEDGDGGGGVEQGVEVRHGEEHADGIGP